MEDFVTYEIAKKLKEKGFPQHVPEDAYIVDNYGEDEYEIGDRLPIPLIPDYIEDIVAPTINQVLKWLRNEKMICIEIFLYNRTYSYYVKSITQMCEDDLFHKCLNEDTTEEEYITYELAALAGIEYSLDNLV